MPPTPEAAEAVGAVAKVRVLMKVMSARKTPARRPNSVSNIADPLGSEPDSEPDSELDGPPAGTGRAAWGRIRIGQPQRDSPCGPATVTSFAPPAEVITRYPFAQLPA
ncbi:hypothetical protein GCM10009839_41590 [Catenulispora yoronensis]|uniref:Uncharacterized protein n=1 Tax=Catenulispora yoronensis TaxID=450799 RepID=A0ABP5FXV2_9ACTN